MNFNRRALLQSLAALGVGSTVFQRSVAAQASKAATITDEMIQQAEWISGITLSDEARKSILRSVGGHIASFETMRKVDVPNSVSPALAFNPAPWLPSTKERGKVEAKFNEATKRPSSDEELAFLPVTALADLVRSKKVTSTELTILYISRLKKYDPVLKCVVNLTEELALKQAAEADKEIGAGKYRGPLHGIPWGAKDLISYPGYPTTWGALPYKEQKFDAKATVVKKLEEAGAVMVAKLTLGALAMGDQWYGGRTNNPWNPKVGSSGSSAGSTSATVAGLVGFAIGSETLGSIVSPCSICGGSGLRPTFGRISRAGCMALSWSMDKLGPIARSLEDCALILGAIHGADGLDNCAVDRPFDWPAKRDLSDIKVGYIESMKDRPEMKVLKELGVQLLQIKLPEKYPVSAIKLILDAEAAAAFDEQTRKNMTEGFNSWPRTFRAAEFIPAVEYIRANRIRSMVMEQMAKVMEQVDMYIGEFVRFGQFYQLNDLTLTNLTGHPTVVMPNGFRKTGDIEMPTPIAFTGRLFGETDLLAVATAYQNATGHHLKHPTLDKLKVEEEKKG